MPDAVGVRFRPCGKIYDFEVNGIPVKKGDLVVVESELGLSIGTVVVDRHEISEKELKKVIRLATEEDLRQKEENNRHNEEYRAFCLERIMARGLPMKLICAETTLDRKRIIFYFVSEGRIDFRELVKDLAAKFRTRIEMRQIGVRDETKMIGGLGICGREVCCRTFLTSFEPVSIKMVKEQEIVLNTSKLSGLCGRLMCCLAYEYDDDKDSKTIKEEDQEIIMEAEEDVYIEEASEILMDQPLVSQISCKSGETPIKDDSEEGVLNQTVEDKKVFDDRAKREFRRKKRRRFRR